MANSAYRPFGKPAAAAAPCIVPNCPRKSQFDGLCSACYAQAKTLIEAGETTWDELSDMGLANKRDKPLLAAFRKAKAARAGGMSQAPAEPPGATVDPADALIH